MVDILAPHNLMENVKFVETIERGKNHCYSVKDIERMIRWKKRSMHRGGVFVFTLSSFDIHFIEDLEFANFRGCFCLKVLILVARLTFIIQNSLQKLLR